MVADEEEEEEDEEDGAAVRVPAFQTSGTITLDNFVSQEEHTINLYGSNGIQVTEYSKNLRNFAMPYLQKLWLFEGKHLISFYYNITTGNRFVLIDFKEVPSSVGYSSAFVSASDRIFFNLADFIDAPNEKKDLPGYFSREPLYL